MRREQTPRALRIPRSVEAFIAKVEADQQRRNDARAAGRVWWSLEQEWRALCRIFDEDPAE
jgi:hypothetical protein